MSTNADEQVDPQKLQAQMASMAEGLAQTTLEHLEVTYDFSPKSLQVMDQVLAVYYPEGFTFDQVWHQYAAYAGEVVRRALGGTWKMESDGSGASLRGVGGKATIYPFLWLSKRIESIKSGAVGDSKLGAKYLKLLQALNRANEAPETIPEDFIGSHAESQNAQSGIVREDKPADDDSTDDDESMDFGVEILNAGPTICFFIVSASDGKIDKKEIKSFFVEVMKFATSSNPLVREVFGSTPSKFEEYAKEFVEKPAQALIKLVLVRKLATEHHPQHAAGYCAALLEMSKNIASASGGFFGFGNKISKDEQQALDMIQKMLEL